MGAHLLKLLGDFARQRHLALTQHGQGLDHVLNAVWRFQQHGAARLCRQLLHGRLALGIFGGQKTGKHKAAIGLAGGHAACHADGAGHAAGTGQGHGAQAVGLQRSAQARAGVAHTGSASIAHIGNALALLQAGNDACGGLGLVVLVHGQQLAAGAVQPVAAQHALGVACVFAGNGVHDLQHVQGAQRDVGQIADRRGDDVEHALWIILRGSCITRCCQCRCKRGTQCCSLKWGARAPSCSGADCTYQCSDMRPAAPVLYPMLWPCLARKNACVGGNSASGGK